MKRTPRKLSPYMLVQEFLRDEPWQLLCAVIMLNQTSARQMWRILPEFLERYPTPEHLMLAPEDEVKDLIRSLGFVNRRYDRLLGMTRDFYAGSWLEPEDLHGIGKYGADSYRIFCRGYLLEDVQDKELRNYVRWAKQEGTAAGDGDHRGVRRDMPEGPQVPSGPR